jgi:hypothetical protein
MINVEECSALWLVSLFLGVVLYLYSSKVSWSWGTNSVMRYLYRRLGLAFLGGVGASRAWAMMLIARRSPAVPMV